mgnify:FL=1
MNYLVIKKSTIKDHNWFLDTNLLDLNTLRKDQTQFIEKNNDTGINDSYNQIRKEKKVEKGYLFGRYGAVPFIKNDFNLCERD